MFITEPFYGKFSSLLSQTVPYKCKSIWRAYKIDNKKSGHAHKVELGMLEHDMASIDEQREWVFGKVCGNREGY